ncbi:hypothetical protein [Saezia sanguinis]|uniref:hypothetical protein n=1 Tax=Saezia sanguinis TaxID=1965230 RepID=UPI00303FC04E
MRPFFGAIDFVVCQAANEAELVGALSRFFSHILSAPTQGVFNRLNTRQVIVNPWARHKVVSLDIARWYKEDALHETDTHLLDLLAGEAIYLLEQDADREHIEQATQRFWLRLKAAEAEVAERLRSAEAQGTTSTGTSTSIGTKSAEPLATGTLSRLKRWYRRHRDPSVVLNDFYEKTITGLEKQQGKVKITLLELQDEALQDMPDEMRVVVKDLSGDLHGELYVDMHRLSVRGHWRWPMETEADRSVNYHDELAALLGQWGYPIGGADMPGSCNAAGQ